MTYNGWANWSTWNAVLWVDNDEALYKERIRWGRREEWTGDRVADFFNQFFPHGTPDMDEQFPNDIDWDEIARNWNDEENE